MFLFYTNRRNDYSREECLNTDSVVEVDYVAEHNFNLPLSPMLPILSIPSVPDPQSTVEVQEKRKNVTVHSGSTE